MTVVIKGENWQGRRARFGKDFTREYTRVFTAYTDNPNINGIVVATALAASAFAVQRGSVMPGDTEAHCTDVEPTNSSEDPLQWSITCSYSTNMLDYQQDPTTRPTTYTWGTEYVELAVAQDLDGEDIVNSANETFDPPASIQVPVDVIKATCTRSTFVRSANKDPYIRHENSAAFTIDGAAYAPGQAILWDLDVDMVEELGVFYRKYVYTFKARRDLYTTTTTTVSGNYAVGSNRVVTLASVAGIVVGTELLLDTAGNQELVVVKAVNTGAVTVTVDLLIAHNNGATVKIRKYNPWQYQPLDMGFNTWDAFTQENVEILTTNGQPIAHPVLLDGNGFRLATWNDATPVRLNFRLIPSADLSAITFP